MKLKNLRVSVFEELAGRLTVKDKKHTKSAKDETRQSILGVLLIPWNNKNRHTCYKDFGVPKDYIPSLEQSSRIITKVRNIRQEPSGVLRVIIRKNGVYISKSFKNMEDAQRFKDGILTKLES
jgi:hypothetical protein